MSEKTNIHNARIEGQIQDRYIRLDSVRNLRDMGGYPTVSGREIAWAKIYRSAGLHEASKSDIDVICYQLGVKNIIDLRNSTETEVEPEPKALLAVANYHWISILVEGTARDDIARRLQCDHPESQDFAALLLEVNRKLALDHTEDFKRWFRILVNEEPPFLFHCTEGKDRTGFAAALFLAALGVDRETIIADYLITNTVNASAIERRIEGAMAMSHFKLKREPLKQLLMVHEDYLKAAFQTIEDHYQSMDHYLKQALGLTADDIQTLQEKFLKPA